MDPLLERCAGLDVHRDTVVATIRVDVEGSKRKRQETRTFPTTFAGLLSLAGWLSEHAVTRVGMEATGVYWKPVFAALEETVECWLLNAQHLHNVPGRKSDVSDSVWICQLIEHGLVRPSFVPPRDIRDLRDLTRYRKTLAQERSRAVQRLEKVLQDAGIKLSSVASKTYTVSGRAMVEALIAGDADPAILADLARGRMREKLPQLQEALQGRFRTEHHGLLAAQIFAHIDFLDDSVQTLDARIEELMAPFDPILKLLRTIPGVGQNTAQVLIAECGADMSRFPTAGHLASWAGICPGNNASGGRQLPGGTRRGNRWLRLALTEAAQAAARSRNTYVAARHAQIRGRRGRPKAVGATRHHILIAFWHIVTNHVAYHELGPDWHATPRSTEQHTRQLVRALERLGHKVTLDTEVA